MVKEGHSISHDLTSLNTKGDQTYSGEKGTQMSDKLQALETIRAPFRGSLDAKACWGRPLRADPPPVWMSVQRIPASGRVPTSVSQTELSSGSGRPGPHLRPCRAAASFYKALWVQTIRHICFIGCSP